MPVLGSDQWHPALDRFSRAYHAAKDTTLRRAVLDILHRINLAHLYDVFLETLTALSHFSAPGKALGSNVGSKAQDVFNEDVSDTAKNQMFWACYPAHKGKPRSSVTGFDRTFRAMLAHAEKWHSLRNEFSIGMLALVPQGANTWFEKLPFKDLPVYFYLVRAVNPLVVLMGESISDRVSLSWKGEEPPEQLLRLEHLETVDEIPFKANPLKLLEEVDVGCVASSRYRPQALEPGRAVTVPADVDENDATALVAALSSRVDPSQAEDTYVLSSSFYEGVDFQNL